MNILIIIFIILFCLSLTDFMFPGQQKLHMSIYHLAFFTTYFLFTIKYYYGPDIALYVPTYENIESPWHLLTQGSAIGSYFEPGYLFFCSLMKSIGLSFWMMSVVISTFYFYVIYKLFKKIPSKKTFALFILIIIDYGLIFAEFRQCLAVSFFILMILACVDKKHLKCIFFFVIASLTHKSGFYISVIALFAMNIKYIHLSKRTYWILAGLLLLLCFVPLNKVILSFVDLAHLSKESYASISHHLLLGKKIQTIFAVYFLIICSIAYHYKDAKISNEERKIQWFIFISLILIVSLYQYYYLLNRIRSYFVPFIIVFMFNLIYKEEKIKISSKAYNSLMLAQLLVLCVYLYSINSIKTRYIEQNRIKSGIYNTSTIFSRISKSEKKIKKEQLDKANIYWKKEFMQFDNNFLTKEKE